MWVLLSTPHNSSYYAQQRRAAKQTRPGMTLRGNRQLHQRNSDDQSFCYDP